MKKYALLILMLSTSAWAAPSTIRFQGRLTDAHGKPFPPSDTDGVKVQISLFDASTSGSRLWGPVEYGVTTNDMGLFSKEIGPIEPPSIITNRDELYLQIAVQDEGGTFRILTPRQKLSSVPYALRSEYAVTAATAIFVGENAVGSEQVRNQSLQRVDLSTGLQAQLVPSTAIMMFAGSCPAGWTFFAPLSGRLPMGIEEFAYTGSPSTHTWTITGSSITMAGEHSHVVDAHTHTQTAHLHVLDFDPANDLPSSNFIGIRSENRDGATIVSPLGAGGNPSRIIQNRTKKDGGGDQTGTASPATNSTGRHTHEITQNGDWRPPHVGVVFCKKD